MVPLTSGQVDIHVQKDEVGTLSNARYKSRQDFLGGPVVKNPLANAGDTDSIPGSKGSHVLWGN